MLDDQVMLTWNRPQSDGGGRVRGYMIEKREIGSEIWQKCNQNPYPSANYRANNLIEGREYEFRVFAVNDAGSSEASTRSLLIYSLNISDISNENKFFI